MHELSIAGSILEIAQREVQARAGARLLAVGLRIGEWAGVEPDSLRFGFEILSRDTPAAGTELKIEVCPPQWNCRGCNRTFVSSDGGRCPSCGLDTSELISGQQLEIAYLDVEER
jgi:hydrogenase nickel incorporation protein HypA/HybF